jgi:hypothetical protein
MTALGHKNILGIHLVRARDIISRRRRATCCHPVALGNERARALSWRLVFGDITRVGPTLGRLTFYMMRLGAQASGPLRDRDLTC